MELLGGLIGLVMATWLWRRSLGLYLACWRPSKADGNSIRIVNSSGGRYFAIFRASSLLMLAYFSALVIMVAVYLVVVTHRLLAT